MNLYVGAIIATVIWLGILAVAVRFGSIAKQADQQTDHDWKLEMWRSNIRPFYDTEPAWRISTGAAEYQDNVRCVVMPCCGFTYDAIHTVAGTGYYDCPLCAPPHSQPPIPHPTEGATP